MTQFSEIYKVFLLSIQDYRIKKLFTENVEVAEDLLETFLYRAIPRFKNCVKDIKTIDKVLKSFSVELDIEEINILSDLMLLSWLDWNNNNILQMNLSLNDTDFKHYSEEKNLKEKVAYANIVREIVNQSMVDYGLARTPFREWAEGIYEL